MPATKTTSSLFHPGELAVQHRAGVATRAAGLERMLKEPHLDGGAAIFLAQRRFVVITARGVDKILWTSPLIGPAGFLQAHGSTLEVLCSIPSVDPLAHVSVGQEIGLIAMEFALRRRFRVNGTITLISRERLTINAHQAFGNCPSYIQRRSLSAVPGESAARSGESCAEVDGQKGLTRQDLTLIRRADTFFLGTVHPGRGVDTSHKGGQPGFVRSESGHLWWPDYVGNNMFNSLGNITVDPEASLMFLDFATGDLLQISGKAELHWITPGSAGDDGRTGRRIDFQPLAVWARNRLQIHSSRVEPSPDNPTLIEI